MTRICPRHGAIEAAFCPICGEQTVQGTDWSKLGHALRRLTVALLFIAVVGLVGFFLVRLAISQHREVQAEAEVRARLIDSLSDGWRFTLGAVSRLDDFTERVAALKSYSEDPKLNLTPLNHEQLELFMSLFGDQCWESNKRKAFDVLSRYVDSGRSAPSGQHADRP